MNALKLLEELQSAVSNAIDELDTEVDSLDISLVRENLRVALNESLGL